MKLSLSGRVLQGGPDVAVCDFIRLASRAGFDLVELRPNQAPADMPDQDLVQLSEVMDECRIGVSMLVIGDAADVPRWLHTARAIGAKTLRVNGAPAQILAACEQLDDGMRLVCQMHSASPFENVALAAQTLQQIPDERFGIMPEPANLLFAGETWSGALFEPLRGRIYGCNAQSIALKDDSDSAVTMNDGRRVPFSRLDWTENDVLGFPAFVKALKAVGYDDFINFIDPFLPGIAALELASNTAAYARQHVSAF